jgi:hypothetical protein
MNVRTCERENVLLFGGGGGGSVVDVAAAAVAVVVFVVVVVVMVVVVTAGWWRFVYFFPLSVLQALRLILSFWIPQLGNTQLSNSISFAAAYHLVTCSLINPKLTKLYLDRAM